MLRVYASNRSRPDIAAQSPQDANGIQKSPVASSSLELIGCHHAKAWIIVSAKIPSVPKTNIRILQVLVGVGELQHLISWVDSQCLYAAGTTSRITGKQLSSRDKWANGKFLDRTKSMSSKRVFSCQYNLEGMFTAANIYCPMSRLVNLVRQLAIRTDKVSIGFQNHSSYSL